MGRSSPGAGRASVSDQSQSGARARDQSGVCVLPSGSIAKPPVASMRPLRTRLTELLGIEHPVLLDLQRGVGRQLAHPLGPGGAQAFQLGLDQAQRALPELAVTVGQRHA